MNIDGSNSINIAFDSSSSSISPTHDSNNNRILNYKRAIKCKWTLEGRPFFRDFRGRCHAQYVPLLPQKLHLKTQNRFLIITIDIIPRVSKNQDT